MKKGLTEEIRVKTWVFSVANRIDNQPPELRSRFLIRYLPEYRNQDYKKVVRAVLTKRELVDEEKAASIAAKLAEYSRDVRNAVRVAGLYEGQECMAIDEVIGLAFAYKTK